MLSNNPLLRTDSYKYSHWAQYPNGLTKLEAYVESRGSDIGYSLMFGLQYFLKEYLSKPFTMDNIYEAAAFAEKHFGRKDVFPIEDFKYILSEHKGYFPIQIDAVPEGSVIPALNVLMRVKSTDPKVPWIVSWIETQLLRAVWYGTTVATNSFAAKKTIYEFLEKTADYPGAEILFKLHDFGARGVSSHESAMIGGAAHLINFSGTDTCEGIAMLTDYYDAKNMCGFSIPATEHSTMTTWGRDNEEAAFRNMLQHFGGRGMLWACVSDSYDIYNATSELWGNRLLKEVQDSGSTLVVRPDSGDPREVVRDVVERLAIAYGSEVNTKGYKVLRGVRVIQGDGVNNQSIRAILEELTQYGWSASNVAFGMGGALLQRVDRDTQKFAYKVCLATIDGKEVPVYKDPITAAFKKSKRGHLILNPHEDGSFETIDIQANPSYGGYNDLLRTVYYNGTRKNMQNLDSIRQLSDKAMHNMLYPPNPAALAQDAIGED
jgi:nicotinamide phosphoribosyltransferase